MKASQNHPNKFQDEALDQMLDLFFSEPPEEMITKAQKRIKSMLNKAQNETILYGILEHADIPRIFLAIRNKNVISVDFGVTEIEFIHRIEAQFDAPIYFDPIETQPALEQIQAYLNKQRTNFEIPTDISMMTDFQQRVLQATQEIPRGRIATYMDIAHKIGNPKAVRAVGQALGRNPIPIVIPCHRVIASNGSLGGYSGGGGLETKAFLLKLEGAIAI